MNSSLRCRWGTFVVLFVLMSGVGEARDYVTEAILSSYYRREYWVVRRVYPADMDRILYDEKWIRVRDSLEVEKATLSDKRQVQKREFEARVSLSIAEALNLYPNSKEFLELKYRFENPCFGFSCGMFGYRINERIYDYSEICLLYTSDAADE